MAVVIRKIKRYGWKPDLPDKRDRHFAGHKREVLPDVVDLRPNCPPVYDQGDLGSCTGNAIAGALHYERMQQFATPDYIPSRLFIYYNERVMEGSVNDDAGAEIRDGIKSVSQLGACAEDDWPYDINQFTVKPPEGDYTKALQDCALVYERLDNTKLDDLRLCLASGFPFVFGFAVYESFESNEVAATGVVNMPDLKHEQQIGGHGGRL